jgi:hypothetical protein
MTQTTQFLAFVGLAIVAGPMSFLALSPLARPRTTSTWKLDACQPRRAIAPGGSRESATSAGSAALRSWCNAQPATYADAAGPPLGTAGGAPGVPGAGSGQHRCAVQPGPAAAAGSHAPQRRGRAALLRDWASSRSSRSSATWRSTGASPAGAQLRRRRRPRLRALRRQLRADTARCRCRGSCGTAR